jgi:hypothetical protein
MSLVTDDMVSAALNYLSTSTMDSAKAKADRVMAEHRRKRVRAQLILDSDQTTAAMREADAEASDAYGAACMVERDAVERDEYHRAARIKADAIIEAWRTENANIRAAEKIR